MQTYLWVPQPSPAPSPPLSSMTTLNVTETLPSALLRNTQDLMNQLSMPISTLFTVLCETEGHALGPVVAAHEDIQ